MSWGDEAASRWSAHKTNRGDLAQEGEFAAAALAGEWDDFGQHGVGFTELAELEANEQSGLLGGATQEAVVADASEAFG